MKTINSYYVSKESFENIVKEHNIDAEENVLLQVFSSSLDIGYLKKIRDELVSVLPQAAIIGSTTDGEILDNNVTTDNVVISCSIFQESIVRSESLSKDGLSDFEIGRSLASKLLRDKTKLFIIFADGIHSNGEDFLNGVNSIAPDVMIAGGLAGDGATFSGTTVFNEKDILVNGAVGVAIDSDVLKIYNNYHFGWQRIGPVMEVTKSTKNVVYEIDGKSAYDIYKYYLGDNAASKLPAIGIEFPLIKEKEGVDIARAVLNKNEDGSLTFAGNIDEGEKVQLGFGNIYEILRKTARDDLIVSNDVESIFIYSCMARRRFLQKNISLEFEVFVNHNIPVSGFFTNGEFFKKNKTCELLNQTMTTIALSENEFHKDLNFDNLIDSELISTPQSDTMVALSHLVNITSTELKKSNKKLQENVNEKTIELEEKILELKKATKSKGDFLANMSHEIRTPLNAMIGFIDILIENEKDEESKKYLDIVKGSSDSLLTIINDILDFSKIESGSLNIESIDFDLKKTITDMGLLFYEKANEKSINLKVFIDNNVPNYIKGDPTRLKQVIVNLISNAIKFTDKGGNIDLNVKFNDNVLFVKVSDTGIGIDPENIKKIFKPFSQADGSTTRKYGGSGLGLAISSDLVRLMGSELKISSKLGHGSDFYFELPINLNINPFINDNKVKTSNQQKTFKGNVLLVEDNKANQMFMKVVFKKLNLSFDVANDGLEAIEKFKENKYDIIFMDENMPNMNGIEATKRILEYEQKNIIRHTTIVALTANALKGDKERFLEAGMDEYLTKPLDKKKLVEILSNYLENQ